jgi:hypothetical protein
MYGFFGPNEIKKRTTPSWPKSKPSNNRGDLGIPHSLAITMGPGNSQTSKASSHDVNQKKWKCWTNPSDFLSGDRPDLHMFVKPNSSVELPTGKSNYQVRTIPNAQLL